MKTSTQNSKENISPPKPSNSPGLSALAYRIGTHPTILRRMLARLSAQEVPDGKRPLAALTTRDRDDPAIALLDAWATVADVLTFYTERIANEGYLRPATERRSVLELARAIGYELSPGVAASTFLAFTVDDAPGGPGVATVPKGTKVQSIPRQGQLPQTFETSEEIEARAAWNALRPRLSTPQAFGTTGLYLAGVNTNLKTGDLLLLVTEKKATVNHIRQVIVNRELGHTWIELDKDLQDLLEGIVSSDQLSVFAFRTRVSFFGHNAPHYKSLPPNLQALYSDWDASDGWEIWKDSMKDRGYYADADIYLERSVPDLLSDSWLVLERPEADAVAYAVYRIRAVNETSVIGFGTSAKVTGLKLEKPDGTAADKPSQFKVRKTTAYLQSERLELAEMPIEQPVEAGEDGVRLELDRKVEGLQEGQPLMLSGEVECAERKMTSEIVFPKAIETDNDGQHTILRLEGLQNRYVRKTVTLNANVVRTTHGETVQEVLGGGDGSQANQRFQLKNPPLTYISAPTPSGVRSTLEVRVNGVLWQEVPSLYNLDARSQSYAVRINDNGVTSVLFGDGESGTRLPSGTENVEATYRNGLGPDGEVDAGSLTLLRTRPLGIREVTNPQPATGAAPPETLERARDNAPLTVLTMGRIISLRDYENFVRAFTGIGKAQAVDLRNGGTRLVHITVADVDGDEIDPSSDLYLNLVDAIDAVRPPTQTVQVDSYERLTFNLKAKVRGHPRYVPETVLADVKAALVEAFAFERREFGQAVTASEVITIIQGVPGVVAADLDGLYQVGSDEKLFLPAKTARWENTKIQPAQLLLIHPAGITLNLWEETR